ncbi:MAG: hypothetical protein Unbinned1524contig1000_35 [Prokaryotic dsDNA virus sp.]|nr:MAG: hypothetical protein Unbinned1524contig1000_35 [Prokaryotic dsDNA virus sp.]|tara:strand:- start:3042 stop:3293 length:252 start_codon:yes stop_codon:yes gene_type:complete
MGKISTYNQIVTPALTDLVIGTDINDSNITKNFSVQQIISMLGGGSTGAIVILPEYGSDGAAGSAGLVAGQFYRTGGDVKVKL